MAGTRIPHELDPPRLPRKKETKKKDQKEKGNQKEKENGNPKTKIKTKTAAIPPSPYTTEGEKTEEKIRELEKHEE